MRKIFLPDTIAEDYKYLVFKDNYVDIYNTDTLEANQDYSYYRCYYNYDRDLFKEYNISVNSNVVLDCVEVEVTHDYTFRSDYTDIVSTAFILVLSFVVLINIFTSIVKKGGVLSGLI